MISKNEDGIIHLTNMVRAEQATGSRSAYEMAAHRIGARANRVLTDIFNQSGGRVRYDDPVLLCGEKGDYLLKRIVGSADEISLTVVMHNPDRAQPQTFIVYGGAVREANVPGAVDCSFIGEVSDDLVTASLF